MGEEKPEYVSNELEIDYVLIYKGVGPHAVKSFIKGLDFFSTLPLNFMKNGGKIAVRPMISYPVGQGLSKILIEPRSINSFEVEGLEKLGNFDCKVYYDNSWIRIIDNRKNKPNDFTQYFICASYGSKKEFGEIFSEELAMQG